MKRWSVVVAFAAACGNGGASKPDAANPDAPAPSCEPLTVAPKQCANPWFPGQVTSPGPLLNNSSGQLVTADINADGRVDIVATGPQNKVWVFIGLGTGVFDVPTGYPLTTEGHDVALGDLDGNGSLDIAVATFSLGASEGHVELFLNNGSGAFTSGASLVTSANLTRLAIADTNQDGLADIVTAARNVQVFRNQGNAAFGAPLTIVTGTDVFSYPVDVAVADVDRDGKADVIAAHAEGDVCLLRGQANGFAAVIRYASGIVNQALTAEDVTGDGAADIVASGTLPSSTSGAIAVAVNPGTGTFASFAVQVAQARAATGHVLGDLDGDGDKDLALSTPPSGFFGNGTTTLLNNGAGVFMSEQSHPTETVSSLAIADADGDGDRDLVLYGRGVFSFLNAGNGSFDAGLRSPTYYPRLFDVNRDGNRDVVSADQTLGVFLGNGDGTFQARVSFATPYEPFTLELADLDGDCNLDALLAGPRTAAPSYLMVLRGQGDGTFSAAAAYVMHGAGASDIAIGDLTGDGRPDVVVANGGYSTPNGGPEYPGSTEVFINTGSGMLAAPTQVAEPSARVIVADVIADGKLDLITQQTTAKLWRGDGGGGLSSPLALGENFGNVADVNNDGKLDLLRSVEVELGNGDGTFGPPISTRAPYVAPLGDLDGDGNLDAFDGGLLLLGRGDGTFEERYFWSSFGEIGDLNNDGYADTIGVHSMLQRCL